MNKDEFIMEINETLPDINLKDTDFEYTEKDTSNLPELSGNVVIIAGPLTSEVTIKYNGVEKTYKAGHGTTFPCEFIDDYKKGIFSSNA